MSPATPLLLSSLLIAACGAVDPAGADEADSALPPSAFTLQFTGQYQGAPPLAALELRRDGTYVAAGGEEGRYYSSPARRVLPLQIRLRSRGHAWTAVIDAYDGKLRAIRSEGEQTLRLVRPQQADEDLCDGTGGQWTDDDADPSTGLYCICPGGAWFIPSSGGCVP